MVDEDAPLADIEAEAARLLDRAAEAKVLVRLLGGAAVGMHRHGPRPAVLDRRYGDIDVVVKKGQDRGLKRLLGELGYVPNRSFNNLHGDRRLLFYDERNARQVDVFIGTFRMCHTLELDDRLEMHPQTLAPADLLLTKLQVVKINTKDIIDAQALLLGHQVGSNLIGDAIDLGRLVRVTSRDWGWYTTFTDNLARLMPDVDMVLPPDAAAQIGGRVATIQQAMVGAPKSLQWKARAAVGRRVAWYELPEEIGRG
ncbi:MAG: nucleotidyltransferase family protein [Chloroflexi bacterium]|nr:MAG: nucleotidyltransferase family protein [Chloroflexota bacterium]